MGQDVPAQPRWGARLPAAPRGSGPALRTPRSPSLPAELLRPGRRGPPQFPAPDFHPYRTGPAASESARAAKNARVNQKRPELRTPLNAVAFRPAGSSNTGDPSAVRPKLRPRPPDVSHTGRGVRAGSRSRAQGVPEPRPHWLHPSPAPADPRARRALLAHPDLSRPWRTTATSLCQRRSGPRADRGDARGRKDEETKRFPTWVAGYAPVSPQRRVRAHTLTRIGTRTRARTLIAFPSATPRSARARTSCALPGGGPPRPHTVPSCRCAARPRVRAREEPAVRCFSPSQKRAAPALGVAPPFPFHRPRPERGRWGLARLQTDPGVTLEARSAFPLLFHLPAAGQVPLKWPEMLGRLDSPETPTKSPPQGKALWASAAARPPDWG